jgi:hypothetical protein
MADPKVNVTIGANTKPFAAGIGSAMASLRQFLAVGAMAAMARQAIQFGSTVSDMGARLQVSLGWLQEVGYAASQAGSSMEDLANAVMELRRAQAQALGGSSSRMDAFSALGISVESLRSSNAEALFDQVADAVGRTNGGLQETNAALEVLGRGGKRLITGMVEGFSESRQRAQELGLVLSDDVIQAMDELGDRLDTIKLGFTAVTAVILRNITSLERWALTLKAILQLHRLFSISSGAGPLGRAAALLDLNNLIEEYKRLGEDGEGGSKGGIGDGMADPSDISRASGSSSRNSPSAMTADALKRIGGYIGGGGSGGQMLRVQTNSLGELRGINRRLALISQKIPTGLDV